MCLQVWMQIGWNGNKYARIPMVILRVFDIYCIRKAKRNSWSVVRVWNGILLICHKHRILYSPAVTNMLAVTVVWVTNSLFKLHVKGTILVHWVYSLHQKKVYTFGKAKYSKSRGTREKVGDATPRCPHLSACPPSVLSTQFDKSVYFLSLEIDTNGFRGNIYGYY